MKLSTAAELAKKVEEVEVLIREMARDLVKKRPELKGRIDAFLDSEFFTKPKAGNDNGK